MNDIPAKTRARHEVAKLSELPPGARRIVTIPTASGKGTQIGVFNVGGRFVAYRNICPHAGAPVCEGRISGTMAASKVGEYLLAREGEILRCPWHGWEFDLLNGEHLVDEETKLRAYPVEVSPSAARTDNLEPFEVEARDGAIWVLV